MEEKLPKTKIFTIFISIFYILGILAVFSSKEITFALFALLTLILGITFKVFENKKILILSLIFFFGIFRAQNITNIEKTYVDNLNLNNVELSGQVISSKDFKKDSNKLKFYVNANEIKVLDKKFEQICPKILVSIDLKNKNLDNILIGDYIKIKGKLRTPKNATNPYQFDYRKYLSNQGVKNILYGDIETFEKVKEPELNKDLNDFWYSILRVFEIKRNEIVLQHAKNIKSPELEILAGIVFGSETINPDENVKENFKNSGLLHLLAASGLNVALIFGIWWWIATLFRFPYNLSIATGAIFVVFYTFMTGFPPSILRASLMLLFVLFGKLIDREANSIALISFVAFLILLFSPKMIFDIGFQLSFIVTIGLVLCVPVIIEKFNELDEKYIEKYKKASRVKKYLFFLFSPKKLASIVAIPLVAQLWVLPLQIYYFNNIATFSLFANIVVVPFIALLSFVGFLGSILALIPFLNEFLVQVFDFLAYPFLLLLVKTSAFFASFKHSLILIKGYSLFQMFLFWTLVLFLTYNIKINFQKRKMNLILIGLILIFSMTFVQVPSKNLEIVMFDVENADSFLIKTPKNKFIMIDTGKKTYKSFSSADSVINPYLRNKRIKELELMIITHFDSDHCGGALDILKTTKVNKILIQTKNAKSELSQNILDYLEENKLNYEIAKNNQVVYDEENLSLKTFVSQNPKHLKSKSDNETSIISLLNYKDKNVLFMADCSNKVFEELKKYFSQIDILKVGHHGAKGTLSKAMLEYSKPKFALVSVGINKFNHPHFETVELLNDFEIKTIYSKNYGFSKIIFENDREKFYNFNPEKNKLIHINFEKNENLPFHKTKFMQKIIKKYSK